MNALIDKFIIFMLCVTLFLTQEGGPYAVVPVIFVIIVVCLGTYFDRENIFLGIFLGVVLFCFFFPAAAYFLPVFCYDLYGTRWQWFLLASFLPLSHFLNTTMLLFFVLLLFSVLLAWVLHYRTVQLQEKRKEFYLLRDEITERQMQLEEANRDLLDKQDYEIHLATLNERNRISSELHDSIGHMLTSSLLQTGAMLATCPDPVIRESLQVLQNSLSSGMDEVRLSIHDLHDESIDLAREIQLRIKEFTFCPVTLKYNLTVQPDKKIRYALLSILKEGLSNIARHSNATEVTVIFHEHPALYQLIIRDNGTALRIPGEMPLQESEGMGLPGIRQRVENLGGNVVFRRNQGFEIFASIPKEQI
jgi:signal transduction histidine kinase